MLLDWENIGYYVLAKNNDLLPKTASALVKWQHEWLSGRTKHRQTRQDSQRFSSRSVWNFPCGICAQWTTFTICNRPDDKKARSPFEACLVSAHSSRGRSHAWFTRRWWQSVAFSHWLSGNLYPMNLGAVGVWSITLAMAPGRTACTACTDVMSRSRVHATLPLMQDGAQIAKLVQITPITKVYSWYIYSLMGL